MYTDAFSIVVCVCYRLTRKSKGMRPTDSYKQPHVCKPWSSWEISVTPISVGETTQQDIKKPRRLLDLPGLHWWELHHPGRGDKVRYCARPYTCQQWTLQWVVKIKGDFNCTGNGIVEFSVLRAGKNVKSKITMLDFRGADFGFLKICLEESHVIGPWREERPKKAVNY